MNIDDFKPENMLSTAFFTGHRFLKAEEKELIRGKVSRCLDESYAAGYRRYFCGCALGFDMLAALETIRLRERFPDVVLSLAIPCKTQADRWDEADRKIYRRILDLADDRVLLSPVYYQGVMLTRNRYMADRSSLCICWLTEMRGGTDLLEGRRAAGIQPWTTAWTIWRGFSQIYGIYVFYA